MRRSHGVSLGVTSAGYSPPRIAVVLLDWQSFHFADALLEPASDSSWQGRV